MSEGTRPLHAAARTGVVFGVVAIILGVLAIMAPLVSGIAVNALVAVLLIAAGITQIMFVFKAGSFGKGLLAMLFGLFAILCGVFIFARPLIGLGSITMILAIYFFADGFYGVVMSFRLRPTSGWGWMLFSSLMSIVLGYLIVREWPVSGEWAVGTLVGVRLIMSGWTMISVGAVGDSVVDEVELGAG